MKKKSIVKEVAKFIAFYDGDSEQENMELARQIVAKVKRHLTQRPPDAGYAPRLNHLSTPEVDSAEGELSTPSPRR